MAATGNAVGCVARREGTRRDKQAAGTSSSPPPGGRLVATTASGSRMGGGTSARWRRLRRDDGPGNDVFSVSFLTMEGCCCLVCDGDGDMHLDGAFICRRRAANELAAQDAVTGLMALSNGQIQGAGVDKDSNSGNVVCRVKRTEYSPPTDGEYDDTGDP
uniref:Uncharacterized protein n=1 Tax=Oryza glaberrima TaxID=4538 RepID=I1PVK4_ORYGL